MESRRYRRIGVCLPRRQELSHDFSPIGDQDALPQPHAAKIFAQLVLEVTDTDGFHTDAL
jgi:hypothetical protein